MTLGPGLPRYGASGSIDRRVVLVKGIAGVRRFKGRSSLVSWFISIVMNRARTRVSREGRMVGLGALMEGTNPGERGVPLTEFKPDGHWVEAPRLWDELDPERIVGGRQL